MTRLNADNARAGLEVCEGAVDAAPLRLLVVTEVRYLGEALAAVLERNSAVAIVTCANATETVALRFTAQADAVLVDAAHPDGMAAVRRLREVAPHLPIIACAVKETDEDVILWAEAGVTGYLPNTTKLAQFVPLVTEILGGEQICSGRTAAALFRRIATAANFGSGNGDAPARARGLTRRERQVAELVAAGLGDKHIARQLNISLATAKTHVHNLLGKLNVEQRGAVVGALLGRDGTPLRRSEPRPGPELATVELGLMAGLG